MTDVDCAKIKPFLRGCKGGYGSASIADEKLSEEKSIDRSAIRVFSPFCPPPPPSPPRVSMSSEPSEASFGTLEPSSASTPSLLPSTYPSEQLTRFIAFVGREKSFREEQKTVSFELLRVVLSLSLIDTRFRDTQSLCFYFDLMSLSLRIFVKVMLLSVYVLPR